MFSMTSTDNMRKLREDLFLTDKENFYQQPEIVKTSDIVAVKSCDAVVKRSSSLKEQQCNGNVRDRRRKHVSFADEEGQSLVQTTKVLRRESSHATTSPTTTNTTSEHLQRSRVKNVKHNHTFTDGICLESTLTNANSVVGTILLDEAAQAKCVNDKSALTVVYGWNNSRKFASATPCCLGAGNRYMFKINAPKMSPRTSRSQQQQTDAQPTNRLKFYIQLESQRIDNSGKLFTVEFPVAENSKRSSR
jgi:hypothetical protein